MIPQGARLTLPTILLVAVSYPISTTTAQKPVGVQPKAQKPAWPALTKQAKARGEKLLKLLRSKKKVVRSNALLELKQLGAGFADREIRALKDSGNFNINEQLVQILGAVLKPEHAPLIALHHKHKSRFGRRYVMKTLATLGSKNQIRTFRTGQRDKDIEVAYYAAIGLIKTTKSPQALEIVFSRCLEDWIELNEELARILGTIRHSDFLPWIAEKLQSEESHDCVTALRLMRFLAPSEGKDMVRPFLDSDHFLVKKAAVNTLRVIVDGAPALPLKKITVFMIIKLAKDWKTRL
jgi:HEAT repeat protein